MGGQATVIAARLRRPFMPWQQHIADVGLELNPDGSLVYGEVDLEAGRQEGKTELKFVVAVLRLTATVATHGPQWVTYTMQDRLTARKRLERIYAPRLRGGSGFREIGSTSRARPTKQVEWRLGMNSGVEHIQFGPASWLQIDTPGRTGGHSDTLDLGLIDEAWAHEDDTIEQAMEPAMLTRRDAQLWVMSAAGDAKSKYLYRKILRGRKLVEAGADSGVAYFEWSAPDDAEPGDPATWRACCPALGFTVTEDRLEQLWAKALEEGPVAVSKFRRAYLCQWPEVPILTDDVLTWQTIGQQAWEDRAQPAHRPVGRLRYALEVDDNARGETWASIGCSDGTHVELVTPLDVTPGTGWVVPACVAKKDTIGELVVAGDGPAAALIDDLEHAGITVRKVKPAEFVQACMQFADALPGLVHIDQPVLNTAIAGLRRRNVGDGQYRWSRTLSPVDIGPANAVTLARWAAGTDDGPSKYESAGMATLG